MQARRVRYTEAMVDPSSPANALSSQFLDEGIEEALVATFGSVLEAQLARGRLEAEGIASRIMDTSPAAVYAPMSFGGSGVKLWVASEHLEAARALLFTPGTLVEPLPEESGPALPRPDPRAEELALRAFRAAVLGFIVLPPVLNVYSLTLLVRAVGAPGDLSARARRQVGLAIAIDAVACAAAGAIGWMLLGG